MPTDRLIITDGPEYAGSLQGLPPWVRAAAVVGIPGVIAVYLVYMLATAIPTKLDAHIQETRTGTAVQIQLLSQICSNTAPSAEERAACWGMRP